VRISNYRSIESLSLDLGLLNLLIGQNNTGKTNFLKAVNLAVSGSADISEDDIFVTHDERLDRSKTAVIDILLQPTDYSGKTIPEFSEFWNSVFTDAWITTSVDGNFVGIRTEIKYDTIKDDYGLKRYRILQWGESIETATTEIRRANYNEDMRTYLQSFYMDANRDIVQDLRNKKSYFGRVTSNYDLTKETIDEIEAQLNAVNAKIIESIPSLQQTKERISAIGQTIGAAASNVEIEPLARKITDLNKGMDIVMQDGNAASFPIAQHGYGTRSWISFLTLSAFIENQNQKLKEDDDAEQFIMLTMEEPEAHLHPQAQRQLFEQLSHFEGQKVVSTHSPSIIAQSDLTDAIYFSKRDGKTSAIRYKPTDIHDDEEMIFREVINTRADLLFASAVILCEGITEELALPVYFAEYFGCAPYTLGVSVINTGGQKYLPYLSLIKDFDLPWLIFSDGEAEAVKTVQAAVQTVFNADCAMLSNVIMLDNGNEYETYLIDEGYGDDIIEAICEYENDTNYLNTYISQKQGQNRKKKIAQKLNKDIVRDYTIPSGCDDALVDLCLENKTEYALPVAKKIVARSDKETRIPTKVKALFESLATQICAGPVDTEEAVE
jgi:putative ATP-dependent endonuclease of OLD family